MQENEQENSLKELQGIRS